MRYLTNPTYYTHFVSYAIPEQSDPICPISPDQSRLFGSPSSNSPRWSGVIRPDSSRLPSVSGVFGSEMSDSSASRVSILTLPTQYVRFAGAWSRGMWTIWINFVRKVAWGCPVPHYIHIIPQPGRLSSDICHVCHMTFVTSEWEYSGQLCPNSGLPGCVPSPTSKYSIPHPGAGYSDICHIFQVTYVI